MSKLDLAALDARSERALKGVHPDLQRIVRRAARVSQIAFIVTEGVRSEAKQRALVAAGASRTMKSRHLTGHAVDVAVLVDGKVRWDWPLYGQLAVTFKNVARELNLPLEWGGDWRTFKDGPHFQLPWGQYPAAVRRA